jgi:hypothetical protein
MSKFLLKVQDMFQYMIKKTWKNNWNIVTKHHFTRSLNYRYRSWLRPHYLSHQAAMIGCLRMRNVVPVTQRHLSLPNKRRKERCDNL